MELFPGLEFGLSNGWILIVFFFGAYGIMLIFFPKNVIARLYDRSGQRKQPLLRRLLVVISVSFLGISIAIGSWSAFVIIILGVVGAHKKILAEEEACLEEYGESYKNYMERIPRYFLFF